MRQLENSRRFLEFQSFKTRTEILGKREEDLFYYYREIAFFRGLFDRTIVGSFWAHERNEDDELVLVSGIAAFASGNIE